MNMQGKNTQNTTVKGRMMDFSPVRKTAGIISSATNSGTTSLNGRNSFSSTSSTNNRTSTFAATNSAIASPSRTRTLTSAYTYSLSERELERKKQAKKERERREEIQRQIELQNQTMDYNRRRIEAAKQELARSQAEESLRNRELRLQREIEEKQQAIAKKQAEQEALLRRQAIERENQAKQRRYEYEKQRAKEELAKRKVGELPRATSRIPVGSASLAPKMKPAPTAISVASAASARVTSAFAGATSISGRVNSLAGSATSATSATSAASAASKFKAPSPVSRIQITASPSRTLFGRIRPAKKVDSEINSEAQPAHPAKAPVPTTLVSSSVRDALQNYDNYDEIEDLEALFDSVDSDQLHGEKSAPTSGNPSATMYYPTASRSNIISTLPKNQGSTLTPDSIDSAFASDDQTERSETMATVAPARSPYSFSDSEKPKSSSLYAESDIANNNSNYILGGRSPFINTDKVQKRPLANGQENFISSDFTSELLGPGSKIKDYTFEEENNSRKTIYAKNKSEKTKAKQQAVIIDDPSMRKTNLSLVFALIAMSIFGALVGAIVYFAFFQ